MSWILVFFSKKLLDLNQTKLICWVDLESETKIYFHIGLEY